MKNIFSPFIIRKGPKKALGSILRRSSLIGLMITTLLISGFVFNPIASAGGYSDTAHWVGTWATSPMSPSMSAGAPPTGFDDQTLRQIVHISIGGHWLRVRFSNSYGTEPLVIDAASVAIQHEEDSIVLNSLRELSFGGEQSLTIPPGARAFSDPVKLNVFAGTNLAVSMYLADATPPSTFHSGAHQTSYISSEPGNYTLEENLDGYSETTSWFFLTGVDVDASESTTAVVTLGDSITDGTNSTTDANARWPDDLARRLQARHKASQKVGVLNEGIGGNRVLNDVIGPNAQARLDRDVLTESGAEYVILLEGINDIGFPNLPDAIKDLFSPDTLFTDVSAEEIIAGYKQIIQRAHAQGLEIFGGTLLPFKGAFYYSEEGELKRQTVNNWIRKSHAFDGVIDFDKAMRDPDHPLQLLPIYDSGDHLHPNDAGYKAMADAVDLRLFTGTGFKYHRSYDDHRY